MGERWSLDPDRYFDPDATQRRVARELYEGVAGLPIVSPHGHVAPQLFADPNASFGSPAELFIIPDHYVFRMLYSQGISLDDLGVPRAGSSHPDGSGRSGGSGRSEPDGRRIWQTFADNFYLFRGTPSGAWLQHELIEVFCIEDKLSGDSAQVIYDQIEARLAQPAFRPRQLFKAFNIEVLCTTDAASDALDHHQAIRDSGWTGRVLPTFRPDAVVNLDTVGWRGHLDALAKAAGYEITSYARLIQALEERRVYFKRMGAHATDHAAQTAYTSELSSPEAEAIFSRALRAEATADDARLFTGHMLMEMARMSIEDGLVMQLHVGSFRNHNTELFAVYGADKGADIPVAAEFTRNLHPLLNKYGNDSRLSLILFNLDEDTYARELAPLAGHYPAIKIGPPWWFHDSMNGMRRYFDRIMETAGIYNTAGFNDDTRAFASIPARHDVWRRASANWVAGLVVRGVVDRQDGREMVNALAYGLAKRAYKLNEIAS
ncbi:MAG: glucuronate isomerase [Anaerolineae bacterium]|jgi:glucuronate isomerase|nr:glucuronate isomerase [Anaerolineae bacterium]